MHTSEEFRFAVLALVSIIMVTCLAMVATVAITLAYLWSN